MKSSLVFLISGLGLFGCTSGISESVITNNVQLQNAELCCVDYSTFPWLTLSTEESLTFNIDESSPVWAFPAGKSYFTGFEFAQKSGSVEVMLRSKMLDKEVIAPRIELLDKDFNLVKTVTSDEFKIKFSDALARNRYEVILTVDSTLTPYMVVYAETKALGEKVIVPHPAKVRAEETGEPMPIVTDPYYYKSSVGSLELEIETLTLSGYKQDRSVQTTKVQKVDVPATKAITVVPETQQYYHNAIKTAVESNNIPKALSLLDEAKALNIDGAQEVFVKAVNAK